MSKYPSRDEILAELVYDAPTGSFTRKRDGASSATHKNGYIYDYVCKRQIPRSVLVWIVETGEEPTGRIKHLSGPRDTRFSALRPSTGRPYRRRRWTEDDTENYAKNRERFAPFFSGREIADQEFAWAVALLS